jgi:hypothetical protein
MWTLVLICLLGDPDHGVVAVHPVGVSADSGIAVATRKTKRVRNRRPYVVIGGLVRGQGWGGGGGVARLLTWESLVAVASGATVRHLVLLRLLPRCGLECGSRLG